MISSRGRPGYSNADSTVQAFIGWYMFIVPALSLATIAVSYFLLRRKARFTSVYIKTCENISAQVEKREKKMTRTILILLLSHIVCNVPMLLFQGVYFSTLHLNANTWYVVMIIYESQFSLNFFIYAGSNEQYRLGYRECWNYCICQNNCVYNAWKRFTSSTYFYFRWRCDVYDVSE